MNSGEEDLSLREANTDDEKALLMAAQKGDVKTLTSLIQKGVFWHKCASMLPWCEGERNCEEEREEEEGGEMREREFGTFSLLFLNVNILFRAM